MTTPARPVALVGFMGAGKSSVGRALARRLGVGFVDLDEVVEAAHGPIARQLALDGEPTFRRREAEALRAWCSAATGVLATGGGAWMDPEGRAALAEVARVVYLRAPLEVLRARVAGAGRPLWDDRVADRLRDRTPVYELADHAVDTAGLDVEAVVDRVLAALEGA